MLTVTGDVKRMLAYSSMENMGLIAVALAAGSTLAIAALLLHVLAHGIGKTVLFLAGGQLQAVHGSTAIADITGVELVLLEQSECGSLGAAMMGAVSMGWYNTIADAQTQNKVRHIVYPNAELKDTYDNIYQRYQTLFKTLTPMFEKSLPLVRVPSPPTIIMASTPAFFRLSTPT
jgi:sugar (pentulose or hexulose) kinase